MKKKWLKKGSAILLAAAMVMSLFPGMTGTLATVQAAGNEAPTSGYWTDATGLKEYNLQAQQSVKSNLEQMIDFGQSAEQMEITLHFFQPVSLHKLNMVVLVNIQIAILLKI